MSKSQELANLVGGVETDANNVNLKVNSINDGPVGGRRNIIINGDMIVAQRGTSFTVTNEYGLDRWFCRENTDGALTFSQDSESPVGFSQSLKVNVDTADTSIGSSQFAYLAQRIEGYNIQPFAFGSSDAKKITLSFYVRCSVTGKFGGAIVNGDNNNRSHSFTYDVNAANTWERKTITFDGDTTGTWNIDNSQEMTIFWSLGGGSGVKKAEGSWDATAGVQSATEATVELIETASATWYITGVQLEVGEVATAFEHRSYGEELALCQRYFRTSRATQAHSYILPAMSVEASTIGQVAYDYRGMRTSPSVTASGSFSGENAGGGLTFTGAGLTGSDFIRLSFTLTSSSTVGIVTHVRDSGSGNAEFNFDSEL